MSVKSKIKLILESVTGIGRVYDRYVSVTTEQEVNDRLVSNGRVNAIFFIEVRDQFENQEGFGDKERRQTFRFAFYYGYSYANNTELIVMNIKEEIMTKFNSNETLNDSVSEHENISMVDNIFVTFGNILCHLLIFEMTVVSELEFSNY